MRYKTVVEMVGGRKPFRATVYEYRRPWRRPDDPEDWFVADDITKDTYPHAIQDFRLRDEATAYGARIIAAYYQKNLREQIDAEVRTRTIIVEHEVEL